MVRPHSYKKPGQHDFHQMQFLAQSATFKQWHEPSSTRNPNIASKFIRI